MLVNFNFDRSAFLFTNYDHYYSRTYIYNINIYILFYKYSWYMKLLHLYVFYIVNTDSVSKFLCL